MRHEAGVKTGRISISQSSPQVPRVCVYVVVVVGGVMLKELKELIRLQ